MLALLPVSPPFAQQAPGPWVHYPVCAGTELTPPDLQLFDSLTRDVAQVVRQGGGRTETSANRSCLSSQDLLERLRQPQAGRRVSVVIDGPSFRRMSATSPGLLEKAGVRPVNPRLFTRPLHIFQSADPKVLAGNAPSVGVYLDREVSAAAVTSAVAAVTGQPSVRLVPFNSIGELARCFERGAVAAANSGCPGNLTWAAILEQDVSTAVEGFRTEYQRLAGRPPMPLPIEKLGPGVHGDNPDQLVLVALAQDYPGFGSQAASGPLAAVPRSDGASLETQLRQESRREQSWKETLFAYVTFSATLSASSDMLRYPFPVVLGSPGLPDAAIRSALSDSYLRALGAWQASPCTAAAERLHRAFLFNAYLANPADRGTQLGLGSELTIARSGDLSGLLAQLKLSSDAREWRNAVNTALPAGGRCVAASGDERFPEDRVFFANPNLGSQYRAMEHLRRASSEEGDARRVSLNNAAACLREALLKAAGPSCHAADRSTYSFYYNPYFYYAVQQASGGRETK
jgi:hypothetical protein